MDDQAKEARSGYMDVISASLEDDETGGRLTTMWYDGMAYGVMEGQLNCCIYQACGGKVHRVMLFSETAKIVHERLGKWLEDYSLRRYHDREA